MAIKYCEDWTDRWRADKYDSWQQDKTTIRAIQSQKAKPQGGSPLTSNGAIDVMRDFLEQENLSRERMENEKQFAKYAQQRQLMDKMDKVQSQLMDKELKYAQSQLMYQYGGDDTVSVIAKELQDFPVSVVQRITQRIAQMARRYEEKIKELETELKMLQYYLGRGGIVPESVVPIKPKPDEPEFVIESKRKFRNEEGVVQR